MSKSSSSPSSPESVLLETSEEITIQDFKKSLRKTSGGKTVSFDIPENLTGEKMVNFLQVIEDERKPQENGLVSLLVLLLYNEIDNSIIEWVLTSVYVSYVGILVTETTYGNNWMVLFSSFFATAFLWFIMVIHEIWQYKKNVQEKYWIYHFKKVENICQFLSLIVTLIFMLTLLYQIYADDISKGSLIKMEETVGKNAILMNQSFEEIEQSLNFLEKASEGIAKFNETQDFLLLTNEIDYIKDIGFKVREDFSETSDKQQDFFTKIQNLTTKAGR